MLFSLHMEAALSRMVKFSVEASGQCVAAQKRSLSQTQPPECRIQGTSLLAGRCCGASVKGKPALAIFLRGIKL